DVRVTIFVAPIPAVERHVLRTGGKVDLLVDHLTAVGRPHRRTHLALHDCTTACVDEPCIRTAFADIADVIRRHELRRKLQPGPRCVLDPLAGCDVDGDDL